MNFRWVRFRTNNLSRSDKAMAVRRSADVALTTYAKTFRDLAKYDRGEPILNSVSR